MQCRTTFDGTEGGFRLLPQCPFAWPGFMLMLKFFPFFCCLLPQEWEMKAGEAKEEYEKAKKEYKESGRMPTSTSKK